MHFKKEKEVFMEQSTGFVDTMYLDHVCKINKALYELK
jgi:hypothetical protein